MYSLPSRSIVAQKRASATETTKKREGDVLAQYCTHWSGESVQAIRSRLPTLTATHEYTLLKLSPPSPKS